MEALEVLIGRSKQIKCLKRVSSACRQTDAYSPKEGLEVLRHSLLRHLQNCFSREISNIIRLRNGNAPTKLILDQTEDPELREFLGYLFALDSYLNQHSPELHQKDLDVIDHLSSLVQLRIIAIKKDRNTLSEGLNGKYPWDRLRKLKESPNSFGKPRKEAEFIHKSIGNNTPPKYFILAFQALIEVYKLLSIRNPSQSSRKRKQYEDDLEHVFPESLMQRALFYLRENPQDSPKILEKYAKLIRDFGRISKGHALADQLALEILRKSGGVRAYTLSKALVVLTYLEGNEDVAFDLFDHLLNRLLGQQDVHEHMIIAVLKCAGVFRFEDKKTAHKLRKLLDRSKERNLTPQGVFVCLGASIDQQHDQDYWKDRYQQESEGRRTLQHPDPNRSEQKLCDLLNEFFERAYHQPRLSFRQLVWGFECDIVGEYRDGERFIVEYDSDAYHKSTAGYDRYRDRIHSGLGIPVIRVCDTLLKQMLHTRNPVSRSRLIINTFSSLYRENPFKKAK